MRSAARRVGSAVLATVLVVGLAACGDDDDDGDGDDSAGQGEQAAETDSEFCDAFVAVETTFADAPETDDPEQISSFLNDEVLPRVETVRENLPDDPEVADAVTTMADAVEDAAAGDLSALQSPELQEAQAVVYPALDDICDLQTVDVTAVDYAFEGVPETLEAGPTVFVMTNESEAGEAHEIGIARINEDVDQPVEEILQLPEEQVMEAVEFVNAVFTPEAGNVSGVVVDLTPGRYGYACFIPVGTVGGTEGSGPPHFVEGMVGEFTVG